MLTLLAIGAIGFGVGYLVFDDDAGSTGSSPSTVAVAAPPPRGNGPGPSAEASFPTVATRNTTRVGGAGPTADAAGVALASYPSQGDGAGPAAALLAPADSWQEALAATPLTADLVGAPLLLGAAAEVPTVTSEALGALAPSGLQKAGGAQLIAIGDVATPPGLETLAVDEADPAAVADAVDLQRAKLTGVADPAHLLVVSSEEAGYAMPAAAWAARSGDPILFVGADEVPDSTLAVIKRHPDAPIYVLGPESLISAKVLGKLGRDGAKVSRVGEADPIDNAIAFARYGDGDFGWNIVDPGHGFAIANTDRPADAAAAAPLAATGGTPGPLLLTDDAETVPQPLKQFLADTQPGFVDDPTRAVYNHVWLLGDTSAISVAFQAQVDALTELAPVAGASPDAGGAAAPGGAPADGAGADAAPPGGAPDSLPPGALDGGAAGDGGGSSTIPTR